jgi:site-specific recombinase XerD
MQRTTTPPALRTCFSLLTTASIQYLARHECGTKICREKGIEYAHRLLGHTNISTTQRYMHLDNNELADAQDLIE